MFFDIFNQKNRNFIFVLLFAGFFVSGCSFSGKVKVESTRFQDMYKLSNVTDHTQIKIVDNFNPRENFTEEYNNISGKHYFSKNSRIRSKYTERFNEGVKDRFLEIVFCIEPDSHYYWRTEFNDLDISAAKALTFLLKINNMASLNNLSVKITDYYGNTAVVLLSDYESKTEAGKWCEINIPVESFSGINFNRLKSFDLVFFNYTDKRVVGTLGIDTIAFIGNKNLYFNSLKDNLFGYPERLLSEKKDALLLAGDEILLREVAEDTWKYFENVVDKRTFLPLDYIKVDDEPVIGDYTSGTNIALYIMASRAAVAMGLADKDTVEYRIKGLLHTLENLKMWHGFHYNYYNTTTLKPTGNFISSLDSAWLAAGLIIGKSFDDSEIKSSCSDMLERMDFSLFLDKKVGQFSLGYDADKGKLVDYHYGILVSEARIISLIAIGKGDVSPDVWYKLYRTLPKSWTWQNKRPFGKKRVYYGHTIFQGYYKVWGTKIVPSWGGSLFEFLMPSLLINEKEDSPKSFGHNNRVAIELQKRYALEKKKYPVWGISPSSYPGGYGSYGEFGVKDISVKGYEDKGIVTPHVSFLALEYDYGSVISNLRKFLEKYEIYGEYGFYDAVDIRREKVSYKYLALDEGMIFVSLANFLERGIIRNIFAENRIFKKVKKYLKVEDFMLDDNFLVKLNKGGRK